MCVLSAYTHAIATKLRTVQRVCYATQSLVRHFMLIGEGKQGKQVKNTGKRYRFFGGSGFTQLHVEDAL